MTYRVRVIQDVESEKSGAVVVVLTQDQSPFQEFATEVSVGPGDHYLDVVADGVRRLFLKAWHEN